MTSTWIADCVASYTGRAEAGRDRRVEVRDLDLDAELRLTVGGRFGQAAHVERQVAAATPASRRATSRPPRICQRTLPWSGSITYSGELEAQQRQRPGQEHDRAFVGCRRSTRIRPSVTRAEESPVGPREVLEVLGFHSRSSSAWAIVISADWTERTAPSVAIVGRLARRDDHRAGRQAAVAPLAGHDQRREGCEQDGEFAFAGGPTKSIVPGPRTFEAVCSLGMESWRGRAPARERLEPHPGAGRRVALTGRDQRQRVGAEQRGDDVRRLGAVGQRDGAAVQALQADPDRLSRLGLRRTAVASTASLSSG